MGKFSVLMVYVLRYKFINLTFHIHSMVENNFIQKHKNDTVIVNKCQAVMAHTLIPGLVETSRSL